MEKTKGTLRDFLETAQLELEEKAQSAIKMTDRVKAKQQAELIEKLLSSYDAS